MKSVLLLGCLVLLVAASVPTNGDEMSDEMKLCTKERRRALVSIKKKIDICQQAVATSTSPKDETVFRSCLAKCVLKQENALDVDDALTQDSFERAIENRATGIQREKILETFKSCTEQYGEDMKPEDESCPGYEAFSLCLQSGIEQLCDDPEALSPRPTPTENPKEEL